jgi:hypothetical protein
MATHELKIWPAYYAKLLVGIKRAEARWGDDRAYAAGDWCWFREWDPAANGYTGNSCQARVRAAERVAPAAFGATGDALWLIELDEVSGIASATGCAPLNTEYQWIDIVAAAPKLKVQWHGGEEVFTLKEIAALDAQGPRSSLIPGVDERRRADAAAGREERTAGGGLVMSEATRATVGALRAEEAARLPWVGTVTVTDPPADAPRCAACGGTGKEPAPHTAACPDWGPCRACQGRGMP